METIKKTYICGENILVVDSVNKLWIMGKNQERITGFGTKNKSIYAPVYCKIILDKDEEIKKFYTCKYFLGIFTSKGKLFVSRNLHNKNNSCVTRRSRVSRSGRQAYRRASIQVIADEHTIVEEMMDAAVIERIDANDIDNTVVEEIIDVNDTEYVDRLADIIRDSRNRHNNESEANYTDMTEVYDPVSGVIHFTNPERNVPTNEHTWSEIVETMSDPSHYSSDDDNSYVIANDDDDNSYTIDTDNDDNDDNDNDDDDDDDNYITDDDCVAEDYGDFDNSRFYDDIIEFSPSQIKPLKEGIKLLEENVDDVIFVTETILFKKNGNLYVYNENLKPKEIIVAKKFCFSTIYIEKGIYSYHQLVLPFDYDSLVFCDDFIYLRSGQYHHVISAFFSPIEYSENIVTWIFFKTDLDINEKNIHFITMEGTIYVKYGNQIYKYCHSIQKIKEFVGINAKTFIMPTNDNDSKILFCIKEDGVYFDHGNLKKEIPYHEFFPYIIDMNSFRKSRLVIIDVDNSDTKRYVPSGKTLFFNVNGLVYYKLLNSGIIYYDKSNILYYCTNNVLLENKYGTMEIEKISTKNDVYYIYMFQDLPNPISNIQFTNNLIMIQSENKYYYHTIDTSRKFMVDKFTEIIIGNNSSDSQLVSKHYVGYGQKKYDNYVTLSINISANKFDKLLNITEMLSNENDFSINFMKETTIVSYGDGPKREFLEAAVIEFSEKYLVRHNVCSEFNLSEMKKFSDDELVCIGSLLHSVICHSNNHLSIRLPLVLAAEIIKKEPTIIELEYFVKLEDPETFNTIYKFKDQPDEIINFGYDSYEDCLKMMCKYYNNDKKTNKKITHISQKIAKGFKNYNEIKNASIMNVATFDYFLSGDYNLDRKLLIKNLRISDESSNNDKDYQAIITNFLQKLPENKLAILLKNWSGTSIVKKSYKYDISIVKKQEITDIHFATCSVCITMNEKIFNNFDDQLIIDILTTPITTMVDL